MSRSWNSVSFSQTSLRKQQSGNVPVCTVLWRGSYRRRNPGRRPECTAPSHLQMKIFSSRCSWLILHRQHRLLLCHRCQLHPRLCCPLLVAASQCLLTEAVSCWILQTSSALLSLFWLNIPLRPFLFSALKLNVRSKSRRKVQMDNSSALCCYHMQTPNLTKSKVNISKHELRWSR